MIKEHMLTGFEEIVKYKVIKNEEEYAKLVFYLKTKRMIELSVVKEDNIIIFDTYTDYEKITEEERKELSLTLKDLHNRMRFSYKKNLFIMPWEYIENVDEYEERVKREIDNDYIKEIIEKIKKEKMTSEESVWLESEKEKEQLVIFGIGRDLGKALTNMNVNGYIKYEKIGGEYFKIELEEQMIAKMTWKEKIHKMIVFSREMKREKYNVWVDYED